MGMAARPAEPPVTLLGEPDWEWRRRGPTPRAVRAFGARPDDLRRLPGGAGHTWTDGRLVLKPVGCVAEHAWVCEVYEHWSSTEVRVPAPVRPQGDDVDGWSCEGWGAHVLVPGRDAELPREMGLVRAASDAFHAGVEHLPRPAFLDSRDDPWSYGDRLAWEDAEPVGDDRTVALVDRLRRHFEPVGAPSQVIHGDVLPNVLVADGRAPGVIDWPPYFRPAGMGNAIAATDAVTFRAAPLSLLEDWRTGEDWDQLLVRAMVYRLGPTGVFAARGRLMGGLVTHVERLEPLVDAVLAR
jgi:uncharacterized protein (TIGR02569 family)